MLKNKKIILIVLIVLVFLGLFLYATRAVSKNSPPPFSSPYVGGGRVRVETNNVTFTDDAPGEMSVYDFMSQLRQAGKINFTEKSYIGMGKLIDSINGLYGNGEQNWIYYVNGKKAQIGVSNYKINKGDIVSWKYEKYE